MNKFLFLNILVSFSLLTLEAAQVTRTIPYDEQVYKKTHKILTSNLSVLQAYQTKSDLLEVLKEAKDTDPNNLAENLLLDKAEQADLSHLAPEVKDKIKKIQKKSNNNPIIWFNIQNPYNNHTHPHLNGGFALMSEADYKKMQLYKDRFFQTNHLNMRYAIDLLASNQEIEWQNTSRFGWCMVGYLLALKANELQIRNHASNIFISNQINEINTLQSSNNDLKADKTNLQNNLAFYKKLFYCSTASFISILFYLVWDKFHYFAPTVQ